MTNEKMPRGYHDLGGLPSGPVDQTDHVLAPWEKRADVLAVTLSTPKIGKRAFHNAERRNMIETMGEDKYKSLTYFELRMESVAGVLYDKGLLTE